MASHPTSKTRMKEVRSTPKVFRTTRIGRIRNHPLLNSRRARTYSISTWRHYKDPNQRIILLRSSLTNSMVLKHLMIQKRIKIRLKNYLLTPTRQSRIATKETSQ